MNTPGPATNCRFVERVRPQNEQRGAVSI